MELWVGERNRAILSLKNRFENGELTNDDFTQHADLIHEWNESREFIARTKRADIRDMEVFNRISQAQRDHLNYMADYYNNKHYTLAKLGCVIAYLDDKLVVYAKYGNARVLTSLKEWGIHLGSVFSMQNLGHNIAIDAMASPLRNGTAYWTRTIREPFRRICLYGTLR